MMEPRFERARVLAEAIEAAVHELKQPIDSIKISGNRIGVSAGATCIEYSYAYHNAYSSSGGVMPGSGHWAVSRIDAKRTSRWRALLRRLGA